MNKYNLYNIKWKLIDTWYSDSPLFEAEDEGDFRFYIKLILKDTAYHDVFVKFMGQD